MTNNCQGSTGITLMLKSTTPVFPSCGRCPDRAGR